MREDLPRNPSARGCSTGLDSMGRCGFGGTAVGLGLGSGGWRATWVSGDGFALPRKGRKGVYDSCEGGE
jgi:hypothetical protein